MELENVFSLRQSVRAYADSPVSEEDVQALLAAADAAPVGRHLYEAYDIAVIQDKALLKGIADDFKAATGRPDPLYGAPLLFLIFRNEKAVDDLVKLDAGIIAENIHLKAAELGLGSVIIYNIIRTLGTKGDYVKRLGLPETYEPLLSVAVGHGAHAIRPRKREAHFKVYRF